MTALSILYVDDDPDIRTIVALALSIDPEITVRLAASAAEALAALAQGIPPDVALLDVMMPDMDGAALVERLRATPATATLPVVFVTARARAADIRRYREQGAIGVIPKPFDPVTLAREIRALVNPTNFAIP